MEDNSSQLGRCSRSDTPHSSHPISVQEWLLDDCLWDKRADVYSVFILLCPAYPDDP